MVTAFGVVALFIYNLRRSTTGLALSAIRSSEEAASTSGIGVVTMKLTVAALASLVAGLGGGLLAVVHGDALPSDYATLLGVVWLAVVVSQGIRSNTAALVAGVTFAMAPQLAADYLPSSWGGQLPQILFGLGAIGVVRNPDGVLAGQLRKLLELAGGHGGAGRADRAAPSPAPAPADQVAPA